MTTHSMWLGIAILALWLVPTLPSLSDEPRIPTAWIELAVERLCLLDEPLFGLAAQQVLPGAWLLDESFRESNGIVTRVDQRFVVSGGDELRLIRLQNGGRLRRLTIEWFELDHEGTRASLQAMTDDTCQLLAGRRIVNKAPGETLLEHLDSDLRTIRWTETLEAPLPDGQDPGGPRIALVDSGLAYDLPIYRNRLARNPDGKPLGYDFWDDDLFPYDADMSRGPFFPIRHGTSVASILLRDAPTAALIPFRYPRPQMMRMGEVVEHAAKAGASILAIPLGSRRSADWTTFADAMRAHPEILAIVSAGNDGENIDQHPIWPAALDLDNMITVTSSDGLGRLAPQSNWGPKSVDIMLPAENVDYIDIL
ncbi:MAG: S8 family serine peptidase, partial [Pseudomonadota bacterium]